MKNKFNKRDEVWGLIVTKGCSIIELSLKKKPMEFRVLRRLQRGHVQRKGLMVFTSFWTAHPAQSNVS
jgi:hypothetical protein